jgi:hypothetical protein
MSEEEVKDKQFWKLIIKKYWLRAIPFVLIVIGAVVSMLYVFIWHVETGDGVRVYATMTFNEFTVGSVIGFILLLIVREILLVGLPALGALGITFAIVWFFTLTPENREELKNAFKRGEKGKKKPVSRSGGFGVFNFFIAIAFLIIVFAQGYWDTPFASLNVMYFVIWYIQAIIWIVIIFGIPAVIILILWLTNKIFKS